MKSAGNIIPKSQVQPLYSRFGGNMKKKENENEKRKRDVGMEVE